MEKTNSSCLYFNKILHYLPIHPLITSICVIIENLSIFSNTLISVIKLINISAPIKHEYLFYISIYNITKYLSLNNSTVHAVHFAIGIIITSVYFIYKLCLSYNYNISINIHKALATLFEYVWFRMYCIFFYDALIYFICFAIHKGQLRTLDSITEYFWISSVLLLLIGYVSWFIKHFCNYGIVSNMNYFKYEQFNYFPFDNVYSVIYDIVVLFEKIILVIIINVNTFFLSNTNNNSNSSNSNSSSIMHTQFVIYFCNWITIILPFINSLYVVYIVFINKHLFLTMQYNTPNKTRIYISIVFSIAIILRACLYKTSFLFYILLSITIILSLFTFIYVFQLYIHNKAIHSSSLLGVLIYSFTNKINIQTFIYEWLIYHKFACKQYHCAICANINSHSCLTYTNYYTILYNEIKYRNQFGLDKYIHYNEYYFDLIEIVNYVINGDIQKVSFYYMYFSVLERYKYINVCLYCNFLLLFESITQNKNEFEKMCKDFIQSESIVKTLNTFLNDYEDFLFYTMKNPYNVYKIALKFNTLINAHDISNFLSHSYNDYNYQLIILRYVYERISQVPLKGNNELFDVSIYNEFIDFHYNNDKMLLMKYSLISNSVVVFKAGGELKCFVNKPFDTLFERNVRNYAVKKFIQLINTNDFNDEKNVFECFIHKDNGDDDNDDGDYVHNFLFKYIIYPSIETDEMIISGDYTLNKNDMLVCASLNRYVYEHTMATTLTYGNGNSSSMYEYLYSFSNVFEKMFLMTPMMYQALALNGKYFLFNDIFEKTFVNDENDNVCKLYYKVNYVNMLSLLNQYLIDNNNNDVINSNSHEMITKHQSMLFQITKQYAIETDNTTYTVYYITTTNTNNNGNTGITPIHTLSAQQTINNNNNNSDLLSQNNRNKSLFQFNDSISVSCKSSILISSTTATSFGSEKLFFKKPSQQKHSNLTTIYEYVIIIAIFCLLIVIICIIFLIIEVIEMTNFKNLFLMYQKYLFFKISIELQPIRLFSNLCIATRPNGNECVQPYKQYALNLLNDITNINTNTTLPSINDIVLYEMTALIRSIDNSFKTIKNDLYKMKSKRLIRVIEGYEVNLLFLDQVNSFNTSNNTTTSSSINDKVNITLKQTPLIQSINIFSNFFTVVINAEKVSPFAETPIRFIWLNLTSFTLDTDVLKAHRLNEMNRNIYQIFINYPSIHDALFLFQEEIEHSFETELHKIKVIMISFYGILLLLNVLLLILYEKFISMYTKILYKNYIHILHIINNEHYKTYAQSFVKNLNMLLHLYEDKPSHLIKVVNNEKEIYIKNILHQHQVQLQLQLNTSSTSNNSTNTSNSNSNSTNTNTNNTSKNALIVKDTYTYTYNKKEYTSITNRFTLAVVYAFTLYLIMFISIVITMLIMLMFLSDLVTYTSINSQLDNYLYSNINAFQLSLIANVSSLENVNSSNTTINEFIVKGISQQYVSLKNYEMFIESNKPYKHLHNAVNVSCSKLYSLNNSNIVIVESAYNVDMKLFTEVVCDKMNIMKYQNVLLVLKEICYVLERLSMVNVIVEYNKKKDVFKENDLYEVYTLVLFVNKIIRGYFNEKAIPSKVSDVINLVELSMKICLVLNAILEIIIECILIWFVMRKMIKVNKVFMKFLKFLT